MERKLAAILSADVHGYSQLMGEDEEATIRTLTVYRTVWRQRLAYREPAELERILGILRKAGLK